MCVCVCVRMAPVLMTEAHFRRKQLHLIGSTNDGSHSPWARPVAETKVWLVGNVCAHVCVVCVCLGTVEQRATIHSTCSVLMDGEEGMWFPW